MGSVASLLVRLAGENTGAIGAIKGTSAELAKMEGFATRAASSLGKIGEVTGRIGTGALVGLTAPLVALGGFAIKSAGEYERLTKAIADTAGSSKEAARQMKALQEIARLPGLGLREAAQASLTLQNYGLSAAKAEQATRLFGNALALAGRGKADLSETLRQFAQLSVSTKVTQENLNTLVDRVPQTAKILREAFGTVLAEDLRKAGKSSQDVVDALIKGLEKAPQATGGITNALENLSDKAVESAAKIGKNFVPAIEALTPKVEAFLERIGTLAEGFSSLPVNVQTTALAIGGIALTAGPALIFFSKLAEAMKLGAVAANTLSVAIIGANLAGVASGISTATYAINNGLIGALTAAEARFIGLAKAASILRVIAVPGAVAAGLYALLEPLTRTETATRNLAKANEENRSKLESLSRQYAITQGYAKDYAGEVERTLSVSERFARADASSGVKATTGAYESLIGSMRGIAESSGTAAKATEQHTAKIGTHGEAAKKAAKELDIYQEAIKRVGTVFIDTASITERITQGTAQYAASVKNAIALLKEYGSVQGVVNANTQKRVVFLDPPPLAQESVAITLDLPPVIVPVELGEVVVPPNLPTLGEAISRPIKTASKEAQQALQFVSTAVSDISRGFVDAIFGATSFGDAMKKTFLNVAKGAVQLFIEQGLKALFTNFTGLSGVIKNLGAGLASVFGSAAKGASSAVGSVSSAAGAVGTATKAIGSAVSGIVGAVSGVVSAVSSVVGNFQMASMNKTLGLIEESARYMKIWMGEQSQNLLWCAQKTVEYLGYLVASVDTIGRMMAQGGVAVAGGGAGMTFNITINVNEALPQAGTAAMEAFTNDLVRRLKVQIGK